MNAVVQEIKNDISGIEALDDWLGAGGDPVTKMLAEFRAERCVIGNDGKPCPNNTAPNWWEHAKEKVALWIRRELEMKSHINLSVSTENSLHMCKPCGCCMKLKVWAPVRHLKDHTTQEQLKQMPDYCWLKRELS